MTPTIPKELVLKIESAVNQILDKDHPKLSKRKRLADESELSAQSGSLRRSLRARKVPCNLRDYNTHIPHGASLDEVLAQTAMDMDTRMNRKPTKAFKALTRALKDLNGDDLNLVQASQPTVQEQLHKLNNLLSAHGSLHGYNPLCFQASTGTTGANPDVLTYSEMLLCAWRSTTRRC